MHQTHDLQCPCVCNYIVVLIENQLKYYHCISAKEALYMHQTHDLQSPRVCNSIAALIVNSKRPVI